MNLQAKFYDRILILHLEGSVSADEVEDLNSSVAALAGKATSAVVMLDQADIKEDSLKTLLLWKEQAKAIKIKIYLVSSHLKQADLPNLVEALDKINTSESARLVDLLAKEARFEVLKQNLAAADAALMKEIQVLPGLPEAEPAVVIGHALETCAKLEQEYRSISAQITALSKQPRLPEDKEAAAKVKQAKKEALALLKSLGVFS